MPNRHLSVWTFWLLLAVVCTGVGTYIAPPDLIRVGAFSDASPDARYPPGWELFKLANGHKRSTYDLVESDRGTVVRARSDGGISTLATDRQLDQIDLSTHPILEWHWKVDQLAQAANVRKKSRSDFAASIVVTFDYNQLTLLQRLKHFTMRIVGYHINPYRMLIYFWGNVVPRGDVSKNVHADWFRQIAVRSGSTHVGEWVPERRNVLEDYRTLFGEEPPPVRSVSITTETNSTETPVTAYYGDILFRPTADSLIGPSLSIRE